MGNHMDSGENMPEYWVWRVGSTPTLSTKQIQITLDNILKLKLCQNSNSEDLFLQSKLY